MKEKLEKYGWIGVVIGSVGLGVSAIVAECRRHKTKKQLIDTEAMLGLTALDNILKDSQIRHLEKQLAEAKSETEEKES